MDSLIIRLQYPLCILVTAGLLPLSAFCGTETIVPNDTVTTENNWLANSGDKLTAVTDGNDGVYIYSASAGETQRFVLANTSSIPGTATIDSFIVISRGEKTTGAGTTRYRHRIRMDGNNNYCDGLNQNMTESWANYPEKFTATPTAAGTCAGSLTIARMDSLNIQLNSLLVPIGHEARVTDLDVTIYYTESGGAIKKHRRRLLILSGKARDGYEAFAEMGGFNSDWTVGFAHHPWLWQNDCEGLNK